MVKNIIIGVLVVLCVTFFFFGLIQKTEAKRQEKLAVENGQEAIKQHTEAQRQQQLAEANAKEAHRQQLIAEQNLLECTQGKKLRKR